MDVERFERVAARFERLSRVSPRSYRLLIAALGALGFAVVGLVVLFMVALLALVVAVGIAGKAVLAVKFAIPIGITVVALLRAIWVKLQRPKGVRLERRQAPALFAEIDRIRRLGRVPRLHSVRIDPSLNAGVSQTPRLGILGWPHNDLVIGLPMLLALSPPSFRAVLAHELGHLSGRHGRTGAWIYRVRATWMQVLGALEERRSRLGRVLRAFFRWYGPFFGAASLALAREQEREADRFSAAATDPRTAADALAATHVADWALERRFWPAMARRTAAEPAPPRGYLAELEAEVRRALRDPAASTALARALLPRSRGGDTHPALAERIAALGQQARLPPAFGESAAAHYLGGTLATVRAELDARWRSDVAERWSTWHEEKLAQAKRLAELESGAAAAALGPDESWERASLTEDLAGPEQALPLAREAAARHPGHAPSRFGLGRLLLAAGEEEGVPHVERAIALDRDAELPGAQLLASHHLSLGRNELASRWIARADALLDVHRAAAAEREGMLASDAVEPHGLAREAVEAFVAPLRGHPRVAKLFLARKRLRHLPDRSPVFVLAAALRRPFFRLTRSGDDAKVAQELANAVSAAPRTFVFVDGANTRSLFRRVKRLEGARVA
jgi:Zn-dependent protease with chaperone function